MPQFKGQFLLNLLYKIRSWLIKNYKTANVSVNRSQMSVFILIALNRLTENYSVDLGLIKSLHQK